MTPDTIKAIRNMTPSKEARKMADALADADGFNFGANIARLIQYVSVVAKEVDRLRDDPTVGAGDRADALIRSLILPEPKDRLEEVAVEIFGDVAIHASRPILAARLRAAVEKHGAKIVFEEE